MNYSLCVGVHVRDIHMSPTESPMPPGTGHPGAKTGNINYNVWRDANTNAHSTMDTGESWDIFTPEVVRVCLFVRACACVCLCREPVCVYDCVTLCGCTRHCHGLTPSHM
jgi:hypothetical protein